MEFIASAPVKVRSYVGVRRIGKTLCLINQKRRDAWICSGSSLALWGKLSQGMSPQDVAGLLTSRMGVPAETARADVYKFVEQLWQRQVIDVAGLEHFSNDQRAAMFTERPHNRNGVMVRTCVANEVLFNCIFDLLVPCNLRCRHCYLDFTQKDIMPFDEICNYLDQVADHGCPTLTLTGGEIFLRKDLKEIIRYQEKKGFLTLLLTNGQFIDEAWADELAQRNLDGVQISMYGTTAETHDRVTCKPGTFDKSVKAARLMIDRGINVLLSYFIQRDNVEEAFGFEDWAKSLGADSKFDTKLVPNRNGSKELLRHAVTLEQMSELFRRKVMVHQTNYLCTAAVGKARITAHGEVFPCEIINTAPVGNMRRQTLNEMWYSQSRKQLREDILNYKPNRCKSCSHTSDCEPCAAMRGFNQPGHMEAPVSEGCFLTTASLLSKGKQVQDTTFYQHAGGESCVSSLVHGGGPQQHDTLVQIMVARTANTLKSSAENVLIEASA